MFKIIKYLVGIVSFLMFLSFPKAVSLTTDYQDDFYSNRVFDGTNYSGQLAYMKIDGSIVYCLNPKLIVGQNYSLNQNVLSQYSSNQITELELIGYYGYGYSSARKTTNYYAATQQLIWEYLDDGKGTFYWTTKKGTGSKISIDKELSDIKSSISNFKTKISFDGTEVNGKLGQKIILTDKNGVLSNYIIEEFGSNYIYINGNNLVIEIKTTEKEQIKFVRKINRGSSNTYSSSGSQNLIKLGANVQMTATLTIDGEEISLEEENNSNPTPDEEDKNDNEISSDVPIPETNDIEEENNPIPTPDEEDKNDNEISSDVPIPETNDIEEEQIVPIVPSDSNNQEEIDSPIVPDNSNVDIEDSDGQDILEKEEELVVNDNIDISVSSINEITLEIANDEEYEKINKQLKEENINYDEILPNTSNSRYPFYIIIFLNLFIGLVMWYKYV